jgi:UDP-galactopyranose mutase
MKKALVVGSGFTGCMFAMMLREKGWQVTVIEKAPITGGGVRTFYHGGHPFTYGPRHFIGPESSQPAFDFLTKYVPMRHLDKINLSYQDRDDAFYGYPMHADDIDKMPEAEQIKKELAELPEETVAANFEEFWIGRVGKTLYERYNKHYNMKAWQLEDNRQMDFGFEATVKRKPLETGSRYEFHTGHINAYPTAPDGYNRFFDIALDGCEVRTSTEIERYDLDKCALHLKGGEVLTGDLMISTTSPDLLFDNCWGELKYVGREVYKIVLPIEHVLPKDTYFLYYPNATEQQTRVTEFKKFTQHKSPNSLITLEVPSMKNKLYPTMIKAEVDKAQRYIDALPERVKSVGRMGIYRYVDIDDIILQGLEFRKQL